MKYIAIALMLVGCASSEPEPYYQKQRLIWQHVEVNQTADGKIHMRSVEDVRMPITIRGDGND